ncbi:MAG: helix-turn-helix transcriptional regulator [Propionibacteriaceae bacterium]|nr:helix-turn-helix transcriptional regulator [Propionibacteriaceae bacterium]
MPDTDICAELKRTRVAAGLTLRQLASRVGVSYQLIARIESGRAVPPADKVVKLAKALGADPDEWCRIAGRLPPDLEESIRELGPKFWKSVRKGLKRQKG